MRLLEAAPDDHVIPERYPDPERPATWITTDTTQDSDLAFSTVVVVVRRRLAKEPGRGQNDFLGWQADVAAGEIWLSLSGGERQLYLSQDVHEVAAVDEDVDRIDDPLGGIISLADLETYGIHYQIKGVFSP